MYELKSILKKFEVIIPECVYKVKPLNQIEYVLENTKKTVGVDESSGMMDLEERQMSLLKQLEALKSQLLGIQSEVFSSKNTENITPPMSNVKINENVSIKKSLENNESANDIVVNASPDCIPYGLLALKNAWKGIFNIHVTVHAHSTVTTLNQEAKEFQDKIQQTNTNPKHMNVKLIWKNSEHTEMITSNASYVPIHGEVNVLRYLSRLVSDKYNYENDLMCDENDSILDICYQLPCSCGNKSRFQLLNLLSKRLQKQNYFGGENWSIADIGAYSAIKRSLWLTDKNLTDNLKKWLERIELITNTQKI